MKLHMVVLSIVLTSVGAGSALAHENHKHEAPASEIGEEGAKARATEELGRLVSVKKVEASWKEGTFKAVEKKTNKKGWEWLITFENKNAKDKTLYVFLKSSGEFLAANFTGK